MLTQKSLFKTVMFLMVVSLLIAGCDRPLPSSNNNTEGTQGNQTNDNGDPYPGGLDNSAVGQAGETNTAGEPTREVLAEGEAPAVSEEPAAESGQESEAAPEETGGGGEGETAGEAAPGEEVSTPAETTGSGESETPAVTEAEAEAPAAEETQAQSPEVVVTEVKSVPATHTVAAGENLYRIGLQYGISWVVIAQANGITNPDRIFAGQVLNIPGGQGTGGQPGPAPTPEGINYIVKAGDTLFKIAQQFKISWVEIAEANGLVNPNQIYAGQLIKIPVDAPQPAVQHLVQPGETLFRISLQYGLPWLVIANANRIDPPYLIYAGQSLTIPGGQ